MKPFAPKTVEEMLATLHEQHPKAAVALYFGVAFVLILAIAWFLLFSGLNASADFVYNQF